MLLEDRRHDTTSNENLPLSGVGKHGEKGIFHVFIEQAAYVPMGKAKSIIFCKDDV